MSELALKLIAENKRTKTPFLDLGNCGLTYLPIELFECKEWLTGINLGIQYFDLKKNEWVNSNNIVDINIFTGKELELISQLTRLQTLFLNNNQIQDISFLENLSQLKDLNLSDNHIQDISFLKNLSQLKELDLSSNKIQDISFLQYLSQLKSLNLSKNHIQDYSFLENQSQLKSLYLSSNHIQDISFLKNLSQLQELDLSSNKIQDISFLQNLSQLQELDISSNKIQDISFLQNLSQLKDLDLRDNHIQDISFLKNLSQLQELDLSSNKIQDISFLQNLSQLQELDISSNKIQDISFLQNLSQLKDLDLSSNQIQDISFLENLSQLKDLDLSSNQIQDISFLENLSQLQELDLSDNKIQDISFLQNLSQLQSLYLSSNQIQDISFLENLSQLKSLYLSSIQIQDISFLQNLSQLKSLNLSYNHIQDYSFLENLSQLKSLYLSDNKIQDISFLENLSQLQFLYLSDNQVQDISFLENLSQLKSLYLSYNHIQDISFLENLSQLQFLYLSDNQIQDISFLENLSQLQELGLSDNKIQDISFLENLSQLKDLDLSSNKIQDISFLQNLSQLKDLDLSDNKIQDISFLQNLSQLQDLNLRNNQIQDIWQLKGILNLENLYDIDLTDNPLPIPHEIAKSDLDELRAHFEDLEAGVSNKRFIKLLFMGDGCVGKTTLYRHLKLGHPPTAINAADRTHGITLDIWEKEFQDLIVNVWDFGGQEIFHGTHRLFLGQRAIYILVWTKQENKKCSEDEQHPLKYWLDFIADYGSESTVLLVENTINDEFDSQQFPDDKALEDLVREFKAKKIDLIPTSHRINCQDSTKDVNRFKRVLQGEIENILAEYPINEFPANRLAVIEELERLKQTHKTLPMAQFLEICTSNKISNAKALLSFLNRAGVVSYLDNVFSDDIILQTDWVLDAMYEALRLTNNPLKPKNGKLNVSDFDLIWKNYNQSEKQTFKKYMLKSELLALPKAAYQNMELERNYEYLMPSLFPACPIHLRFEWSDKKEYWVIKFRFMYVAFMQRLQVKILNYCHYQEEESLFKNYLAFTGKQNERCNIEALEEIKEMRIWTNTPKFYVEIFNLINEIYPLERLQVFERISQKEDRRIEFMKAENQKFLMKEENKMQVVPQTPTKVFATYCWTDKEGKNDEAHQTKVHSLVNALRKRGFDATFDKALNDTCTANDFMRMMVENIYKSDKVVVVLSEGYAIKANEFKGGVGDEYELLINDIKQHTNKYILVSFSGRGNEIYPFALQGRDTVDLSKLESSEIENLIKKLKGVPSVILEDIGIDTDTYKPLNTGSLF